MRRILIVGATSAIAEATARLFATQGDALFLVGRNPQRLASIVEDLRVRTRAPVESALFEADDYASHSELINKAHAALGGLDVVLIAHGTLPDQSACESSFENFHRQFETNALGAISLLTHVANMFEEQGNGTIAVISSVAGDRGRASNYAYGSAKATLTAFVSGLRNRLAPAKVHVLTIKPGFVDSPMTRDFPKGPLWSGPEAIARGIDRAIHQRREVVYLPWFWRPIMRVLREIPELVFKRLRL